MVLTEKKYNPGFFVNHHKRLLAKARPDPDFRYFSNSTAFFLFEKATYETRRHGLNFEVCGERPSLWACSRL